MVKHKYKITIEWEGDEISKQQLNTEIDQLREEFEQGLSEGHEVEFNNLNVYWEEIKQ